MARALRKTVRKKHSRRSHIFGWIAVILGIILFFASGGKNILTGIAVLVILIALIFEDRMNGYLVNRRMIPGLRTSVCTFCEEEYLSETELGKSAFQYKIIDALAEDEDYFFFIFGKNHVQIYDKNGLKIGNVEEFRKFIEDKTEKIIYNI